MIILGIETSCDETSAAVVDDKAVLSNQIATQAVHENYGGVVPEFASRAHMRQLLPIIKMAMEQAKVTTKDLDGIAVTYGPGLAGSLLVGLSIAKGMAMNLNIPLIGVHHIEGHIFAVAADEPDLQYPFIAMVASGGHTILVKVDAPFQYKIIGQTIDDAAGEAFDKVSKILGLGYPGGPKIEKTAKHGNAKAYVFPRALMEKGNLNFSFSGLKTAVLYQVQAMKRRSEAFDVADVAASFQQAVVDVLVEKTLRAVEQFNVSSLILAGGVIRNSALRQAFKERCQEQNIDVHIPAPILCTDNAGMIARVGHMRLKSGKRSSLNLDVAPSLSLEKIGE